MPEKKSLEKPAAKKSKARAQAKRGTLKQSAPRRKISKERLAPEEEKIAQQPPERYWETVGRRKTAVARVRLFTKGDKGLWVNGKPVNEYFRYPRLRETATEALEKMKSVERFHVKAKVSGGGLNAQAEAIRHGAARALVLFNSDFRKRLKRAGFLMRDPRMKERKKFGLKGARRAPQWQKR